MGDESLGKINFNRCLTTQTGSFTCQIHHFSDASESGYGYGYVSYLRSEGENGVSLALLYSKARVSPINRVTIPRLELCAALLAVKVDLPLRQELDVDMEPSVFWCDSQIVLAYIVDASKRYHTFVANRVSQIASNSTPSQWCHVPGIKNPADIASRGADPDRLMESEWFTGPEFLSLEAESWPPLHLNEVVDYELEIKQSSQKGRATVFNTTQPKPPDYLEQLTASKSSLYSLKRIVGWPILIKQKLRKQIQRAEITCTILDEAEKVLIKHEQSKLNLKEYDSLSPYVDKKGLGCVGGRLRNQDDGHPNPLLIPKGHLCMLLVREQHIKLGHMGVEYVLAQIRAGGKWVARRLVKSTLNRCVTCKRHFANPQQQKRPDLPVKRVTPSPPFTYTGVDCFGPFLIKRGRMEVMRWGCIFTCLSRRAIHIEKLDDLSTECFLNALMRFVGRRGRPISILSDNGGNFVKSNTELRKGITQWNHFATTTH